MKAKLQKGRVLLLTTPDAPQRLYHLAHRALRRGENPLVIEYDDVVPHGCDVIHRRNVICRQVDATAKRNTEVILDALACDNSYSILLLQNPPLSPMPLTRLAFSISIPVVASYRPLEAHGQYWFGTDGDGKSANERVKRPPATLPQEGRVTDGEPGVGEMAFSKGPDATAGALLFTCVFCRLENNTRLVVQPRGAAQFPSVRVECGCGAAGRAVLHGPGLRSEKLARTMAREGWNDVMRRAHRLVVPTTRDLESLKLKGPG